MTARTSTELVGAVVRRRRLVPIFGELPNRFTLTGHTQAAAVMHRRLDEVTAALQPVPNDLDQPTHDRIVKRLTTLQARAAMLGVELIDTGFDEGYCLRQDKTLIPLANFDEVEAILLEMELA